MNSPYRLDDNKVFELEEFPQINNGDKVVVLFTGGIKSTLAALVAKKLYGIENIIFGFISMDAMGNSKKNNSKNPQRKKNYEDGFKKLGGVHKFELGNESFTVHKHMHNLHNKKILNKFPSVKYNIAGYNKVHEEAIEMLMESGWSKGLITNSQLPAYLNANPNKFKTLHYAVKNFDLPMPFINDMVDFDEIHRSFYAMVRPFRDLDDSDIIKLYYKMNLLKELYQTKSCDISENDQHCGNCRNCQERKTAFSRARVGDITQYSLN